MIQELWGIFFTEIRVHIIIKLKHPRKPTNVMKICLKLLEHAAVPQSSQYTPTSSSRLSALSVSNQRGKDTFLTIPVMLFMKTAGQWHYSLLCVKRQQNFENGYVQHPKFSPDIVIDLPDFVSSVCYLLQSVLTVINMSTKFCPMVYVPQMDLCHNTCFLFIERVNDFNYLLWVGATSKYVYFFILH